jgi:inorganic triphosphatase YgiF
MTLRVRRQRRQFVDTIKAEAPARLDLLERREWEASIKNQPALDALKIDRRISDLQRDQKSRACALSSGYAKEEIIYVA